MSKILFFSKYKQLTNHLQNYTIIHSINEIKDDCLLIVDVENINELNLNEINKKTQIKTVGICDDLSFNHFFFEFSRIITMPCNIKFFIYTCNQLMYETNIKKHSNIIINEALQNIMNEGSSFVKFNALLIELNLYNESFDFVKLYSNLRHLIKEIRISSVIDIQVDLSILCNWQKRDILMIIAILCYVQQPVVNLKITRENNEIKFFIHNKDIAQNDILDYMLNIEFITKKFSESYNGFIFTYKKI